MAASRVWAFALTGLVGCTTVLGIDELPRRDHLLIEHALEACGVCAERACATEVAACANDVACRRVYAALARCGVDDLRCRGLAEQIDLAAALGDRFTKLDACRREKCVNECYGAMGFAKLHPACACRDTECALEIAACVSSTSKGARGTCDRAFACFYAGEINPDRGLACGTLFPELPDEQLAVVKCGRTGRCPGCPFGSGQNFECSGNYRWRNNTTSEVELRFHAAPFTGGVGAPLAGASFHLCDSVQCDCAPGTTFEPNASATSGPDGVATMRITGDRPTRASCLHVVPSGELLPTIVHLGRPQTHRIPVPFGNPAPLMTRAQMESLVNTLGGPYDPAKALVIGVTFDCTNSPANGVTVEEIPGAKVVFLKDGTPDINAKATDVSGLFIATNVPAGAVRFRLRQADAVVSDKSATLIADRLNVVVLFPTTVSE